MVSGFSLYLWCSYLLLNIWGMYQNEVSFIPLKVTILEPQKDTSFWNMPSNIYYINHTRKSHRLFALDSNSNNILSLSAPVGPRRLAIKELCSQFLGRSPCLHGSGWFPQSKWITHLSLQLGGTKMTTSKWISGRGGGSNHSKSFKLFLLSSLLGSSLLDL